MSPHTTCTFIYFDKHHLCFFIREDYAVYRLAEAKKMKKESSIGWFRSSDIRVMSPARFRCATMLIYKIVNGRTEGNKILFSIT